MVLGYRGFGDLLTGTVVTQTRALCIIFGTAILLDCTNTGPLGGEVAFALVCGREPGRIGNSVHSG